MKFTLHCGGALATEDQVFSASVPTPTATYFPVSNEALLNRVSTILQMERFEITERQYALAKGGMRMFALMGIRQVDMPDMPDYRRVLAVRNSYDGSMTAGLCLGSQVFVCDNLAMSGEVSVFRKHTKNIYESLPGIILNAVGKLALAFKVQDEKLAAYKAAELTQRDSDHLVCELFRQGVLSVTDIRRTLNEYEGRIENGSRKFRHEEFSPRNAWSLFNGVTEVLKNVDSKGKPNPNLWDLSKQTRILHSVFDNFCGIGQTIDVETETMIEPAEVGMV